MSTSQKSDSNARQSANRTTSKHGANLQKNSPVYFQIGLIVALILALFSIEYKTVLPSYEPATIPEVAMQSPKDWDQSFVREKSMEPHPEIPKTSEILPPVLEPSIDPIPFKGLQEASPQNLEPGFSLDSLAAVPESPIEIKDFIGVERAPVFPGCESLETNRPLKICMQEKMNAFIQQNFDIGIGEQYGLTGLNRVDVQFTIDEFGRVTDLKTRAPHPALQQEAIRVMNKLPQMQPGKQHNRKVRVLYRQPISFRIQD